MIQDVVEKILYRHHTGFSVHSKVRAESKSEAERVGKYIIRPLLSLMRLFFDETAGKLRYQYSRHGLQEESMDYLENIARVTSHTPDKGHNMMPGLLPEPAGPATVSVVKGNDCRDIAYQSMMNIENEIMASLGGKKRILLKPNFVRTGMPFCAANAESVGDILYFLKSRWKESIVIGESTASPEGTKLAFKEYGYLPLEKEYGVTIIEMDEGPTVHPVCHQPGKCSPSGSPHISLHG